MISNAEEPESLQQIVGSFQNWLESNYLSKRMNVTDNEIAISNSSDSILGWNIFYLIIIAPLFILCISWIIIAFNAVFITKIIAAFFLLLCYIILVAMAVKGGIITTLTLDLNKKCLTTTSIKGIFSKRITSGQIRFIDITKVQLWKDPYDAGNVSHFYSLDIWTGAKKCRLIRFEKISGYDYPDTETYIAEQTERILNACVKEYNTTP